MEYSLFVKLAEQEINKLYEALDESGFAEDFDLINDILYIYSSNGEYVINQHSPSRQIWLSSPVSNAGYFSYNQEKKEWLDKNGVSLKKRVFLDLNLGEK